MKRINSKFKYSLACIVSVGIAFILTATFSKAANPTSPNRTSHKIKKNRKDKIFKEGWHAVSPEPVSLQESRAYFDSLGGAQALQKGQPARTGALLASASAGVLAAPINAEEISVTASALAIVITDEIVDLARGLRYDPKLIYDYVHNQLPE